MCVGGGGDEGVPFLSLSQMQMFLELSCIDLFSMDDNSVLFF